MSKALNAAMKGMQFLEKQIPRNKKSIDPIKPGRWRIFKGDKVEVISGPEMGKQGTVLQVIRAQNRVIIEGVNVRRRTQKPENQQPGRMLTYPGALDVSHVSLICPTTNLPTRISRRFLEDGTRVRVSSRSGTIIPKPEWKRNNPRRAMVGPKDTLPADVYEVTYTGYIPIMKKQPVA